MARDTSRRGTPRSGAAPSAGRGQRPTPGSRPAAARTPRAGSGRRPVAARPASSAGSRKRGLSLPGGRRKAAPRPQARPTSRPSAPGARPAFLDNAAGARAQAPQGGRERRERYQRAKSAKVLAGVLLGVACLAVVLLIAYAVLSNSSAFMIQNVVCEPTEHVSESDIQNLLSVPEGATLLNFDQSGIEDSLRKDPWVASLTFERQFPDTLKITINEQSTDALVLMNAGSIAWYLGSSGTWIQPTKISVADNQSVNDAALARATSEGVLLITGVPSSVSPKSGSEATDDVFSAVQAFRDGFSRDFSSQVVAYSAPSADNVSCVLSSGVEVSLGSASQISTKESIAKEILAAHPGKVTYINVRVASSTGASFRSIDSDDVEAGSGVSSSAGE